MSEETSNIYAPTEVPLADVVAPDAVRFASRGKRLAAALIDAIIVAIPISILAYFVLGSLMPPDAGFVRQFLVTLVAAALNFCLYAAINWKSLEARGQSVGKQVMKIRIERNDGSAVGARHVMFRRYLPVQAASLVPMVGGLLAMVDALFIFRDSHACLHDSLADTRVVEV